MEKQYSVQFFTSFVDNLQELCRTCLTYNEFVEVSGYVCLEIDNVKKERYVLSELLQSSGNVVSESYCTKAFKMSRSGLRGGIPARDAPNSRQPPTTNRNIENMQRGREKTAPQKSNVNRRRSWNESPTDHQNVPPKVRRPNEIIEIIDETDRRPVQRADRERMKPPSQMYSAPAHAPAHATAPVQRQRYPAPSAMPPTQHLPRAPPAASIPPAGQRRPQELYNTMNMQRTGALRHPGLGNAPQRMFNPTKRHNQDPSMLSSVHGKSPYHSNQNPNSNVQQFNVQQIQSPVSHATSSSIQQFNVQHVQNPNPSLPSNLGPALVSGQSPSTNHQPGIHQFNVQRPQPPTPSVPNQSVPNQSVPSVNIQPVNIKLEFASGDQSQVDYSKKEAADSISTSVKTQSQPVSQTSQSECSQGQTTPCSEDTLKAIKQEPVPLSLSLLPGFDEDEIIDLDLFDDELVDMSAATPDDQTALAKEYAVAGSQTSTSESPFTPSTQKVVAYSVKQFKKFHFMKSGLDVNPFTIAPQQFDQLLLDFYKGVRKVSGEELTGRTLKNVQIHLNMFYRDQQYPHSLVKDDLFQASRDYVKNKLDTYVPPQKHVPVSNDDIEALFQSGALGCQNPDSLINTMWFMNTRFFGTKRPADHFNMKWGSISLKRDDMDQEYLESIVNNTLSLKVFAKPENPSRCFVNFYKQFQCLRPKDSLYPDSPFYLKFQRNIQPLGVWFLNEPSSLSQFQYMWKKLAMTAHLPPNKRVL